MLLLLLWSEGSLNVYQVLCLQILAIVVEVNHPLARVLVSSSKVSVDVSVD